MPLAAGRAAFGLVAVAAAAPLCRLAKISLPVSQVRTIVAVVDGASVLAALAASSTRARYRVSVLNATTDLAMGLTMIGLATRRTGVARAANVAGAIAALGGASAWANAARHS
jgi:hypothetical protein